MQKFWNFPDAGDTTYHRDGTITVWDIFRTEWIRARPRDLEARIWASQSVDDRAKWRRHADRHADRHAGQQLPD